MLSHLFAAFSHLMCSDVERCSANICFLTAHLLVYPYSDLTSNRLEACFLLLHCFITVLLSTSSGSLLLDRTTQIILAVLVAVGLAVFVPVAMWDFWSRRFRTATHDGTQPAAASSSGAAVVGIGISGGNGQ